MLVDGRFEQIKKSDLKVDLVYVRKRGPDTTTISV